LIALGVGYLSIISASPPQLRSTSSASRAPVCVRTRRARRVDPCVRRVRPLARCRRQWTGVLTAAIAALAFAGAAFAGTQPARTAPAAALRADIGQQQPAVPRQIAGTSRGITNAARPAPAVPRQTVRHGKVRGAVVSKTKAIAISRARGLMLSRSSISTRRPSGSPPITRQIGVPTSSAIGSAIQGRIDSRNQGPNRLVGDDELRDTRLMLQIGLGLGLAYLAFLVLWLWATRLRPGAQRSAGA
jgi:hypothetical protein